MTLNPIMSDQISYEKPVGAAPSVLESVIGTLTDLGRSYADAAGKKGDDKREVLSAYVREQDKLDSMKGQMSRNEYEARSRSITRAYKSRFADLASEFDSISENEFAMGPNEGDIANAIDDRLDEWASSHPEGMALAAEIQLNAPGGQLDDSGMQRLREGHLAFLQREARISSFEGGNKTAEIKWQEVAPMWAESVGRQAEGLMAWASKNHEIMTPEETMESLNQMIFGAKQTIAAEGRQMGIPEAMIQEKINEVIAPLTNLQTMYTNNAENTVTIANAYKKAQELNMSREFSQRFGLLGGHPDFQRMFFENFTSDMVTNETVGEWMRGLDEMARDYRGFDFQVDALPGVGGATVDTNRTTRPEKVSDFRRQAKENPQFLKTRAANAAASLGRDASTPAGKQMVHHALQELSVIGEANDGPMTERTLRMVFSPTNLKNIQQLGEEGKVLMADILSRQVRQYRNMYASSGELLSNTRIAYRGGRFVAERQSRMKGGEWTPIQDGSLADIAKSVNYLRSVAQQVPGVDKAVENSTQYLFRGIEPSDDMNLEEDITWGDLENVQHTSYQAPNALVGLIDKTEGGGDYDTLFNFQNRGDGMFADVRVSEMTIGQAINFSSPKGAYGQYVKGKVGRVATPMGRYQIVGTTLRAAANEMGLPEDTLFNAKTQDAIFHHLAAKRVNGKSGAAARTALRQEWEGFKHVSDSDLDAAIAAFKGTPAPTGDLDRGVGGPVISDMGEFGDVAMPEPRKSNGFVTALAEAPGVDVRAQVENPRVDTTSGPTDIDSRGRASSVAAREDLARVMAALKRRGLSDAEVAEIMAEAEQEG